MCSFRDMNQINHTHVCEFSNMYQCSSMCPFSDMSEVRNLSESRCKGVRPTAVNSKSSHSRAEAQRARPKKVRLKGPRGEALGVRPKINRRGGVRKGFVPGHKKCARVRGPSSRDQVAHGVRPHRETRMLRPEV